MRPEPAKQRTTARSVPLKERAPFLKTPFLKAEEGLPCKKEDWERYRRLQKWRYYCSLNKGK